MPAHAPDTPATPATPDAPDTANTPVSSLSAAYADQGGALQVFSAKVAAYQQSRPDYPQGLVEGLAGLFGLGGGLRQACPERRRRAQPELEQAQPEQALARAATAPATLHVVDVGAGTGLLTRSLLAQGWQVTAIEPNPAMLAALQHDLGTHAGLRALAGQAEAMPLPDASVDLITAAQAFHWFDIDASRAECRRVLRDNGWVALIWNDRLLSDPLHQALDEVFADVGGAKRGALLAHEERQHVARFFGVSTLDQASTSHPDLFKQQEWPHVHWLDAAGLRALAMSRSYMPDAHTEAVRDVGARIDRIFASHALDGRVAVRYTTALIAGHARLLGASR